MKKHSMKDASGAIKGWFNSHMRKTSTTQDANGTTSQSASTTTPAGNTLSRRVSEPVGVAPAYLFISSMAGHGCPQPRGHPGFTGSPIIQESSEEEQRSQPPPARPATPPGKHNKQKILVATRASIAFIRITFVLFIEKQITFLRCILHRPSCKVPICDTNYEQVSVCLQFF